MSWDGYVNQLMESGAFESVCLMGQDGTVWASTPDFGPRAYDVDGRSVNEVEILQKSVLEGSAAELRFNGQKFMFLRRDEQDVEAGKIFTAQGQAGKVGLAIVSTATAYVVGTCNEESGQKLPPANLQLCAMAEYLLGMGI